MKNIIIDTDMGVDDIIAICLLLKNPAINIQALSTIQGVADLDKGTQNLARILTFIGKTNIPIYKGSILSAQKVNFPKIDQLRANNLTLLKDITIPKIPSKKVVMKKLVPQLNSRASLLCLGPLTNIARAIKNNYRFIQELIIMGGAVFSHGNVSPDYTTEYNFALDPPAAKFIFNSGLPITLIATDTTKQAPAKDKVFLKQVLATNPQTPNGQIIKAIIVNNRRDFIDFYDPLAAAILINPEIASGSQKINMTILPNGQTIGQLNPKSNIKLITQIDREIFYRYLISSI